MKCGIKNKDIRDFEKTVRHLDAIMDRINQYNPDAEIYANMETFELHGGPSFNDSPYFPKHIEDNIAASEIVKAFSAGEQ